MDKALLFTENQDPILVTAEEVKSGKYTRDQQFVDPKYEYRVKFVKGAKNNGAPHFRLYYSYEEYKRLFPDRADRYAIVANMRKYEESMWHKEWKDSVSGFCKTEECLKNPASGKWKFADALFEKENLCIEFQNSYISYDFEDRNKFYSDLSFKTIWLYNLPNAVVKEAEQGYNEILEDNSRGFFRISEKPENLKNYFVYIQVRSKQIYRVTELFRKEIDGDSKSTIRYFYPSEVYTKQEFIEAIKDNRIILQSETIDYNTPQPLSNLWDSSYSWMVAKNIETGDEIMINRDKQGNIFRDFVTGQIRYKYVDKKFENSDQYPLRDRKEYSLSTYKENKSIWIRLRAEFRSKSN